MLAYKQDLLLVIVKESGLSFGWLTSVEAGVGVVDASAGGFVQVTNAKDVNELKGAGLQVSVGGGEGVGGAVTALAGGIKGDGYKGVQVQGGVVGGLPVGASAAVSYTFGPTTGEQKKSTDVSKSAADIQAENAALVTFEIQVAPEADATEVEAPEPEVLEPEVPEPEIPEPEIPEPEISYDDFDYLAAIVKNWGQKVA